MITKQHSYKFIFSLFIIFFMANSSFSQKAPCKLLHSLLIFEGSRKAFHLDKYPDSPIIFIDLKNYFTGCKLDSAYNRKVEVVPSSPTMDNSSSSNFIIKSLKKKGRKYTIEIYHKLREAYGFIVFKLKNGDFVIEDFSIGNF